MSCSDCVTEINTCLTHGASYTQDVELTVGYEEYRTLGYIGRMNILDYEGGTQLLQVTSAIETDNTMSFAITPAQSETLPEYDLFYYVELYLTTDIERLYQGSMSINL